MANSILKRSPRPSLTCLGQGHVTGFRSQSPGVSPPTRQCIIFNSDRISSRVVVECRKCHVVRLGSTRGEDATSCPQPEKVLSVWMAGVPSQTVTCVIVCVTSLLLCIQTVPAYAVPHADERRNSELQEIEEHSTAPLEDGARGRFGGPFSPSKGTELSLVETLQWLNTVTAKATDEINVTHPPPLKDLVANAGSSSVVQEIEGVTKVFGNVASDLKDGFVGLKGTIQNLGGEPPSTTDHTTKEAEKPDSNTAAA